MPGSVMKLVMGLGNIGKEYQNTRHNVGFMCLDRFAASHKLEAKNSRKYAYYKFKDCLLIKPKTYMNLSGEAYLSALGKHSEFEQVLVILDDAELPLGQIRIRASGGDGGHNGLKSILSKLPSIDVPRIRIGIGRPREKLTRDYVLDNFGSDEMEIVEPAIELIAKWLDLYVKFDLNKLLDKYSKFMKRPIPPADGGINRPKEENDD